MRSALAIVVFAALSCGEPQLWPEGVWEGETTLVHLDTGATTVSAISLEAYYPWGPDNNRLVLRATLPGRTMDGGGSPPIVSSTTMEGRSWYGGGPLGGRETRTLFFEVSWRADRDPSSPPTYRERASLHRLRDWAPPPR